MRLRGNRTESDKIFWLGQYKHCLQKFQDVAKALHTDNLKALKYIYCKTIVFKNSGLNVQIKRLEDKQYLKKVEGKKLYN